MWSYTHINIYFFLIVNDIANRYYHKYIDIGKIQWHLKYFFFKSTAAGYIFFVRYILIAYMVTKNKNNKIKIILCIGETNPNEIRRPVLYDNCIYYWVYNPSQTVDAF